MPARRTRGQNPDAVPVRAAEALMLSLLCLSFSAVIAAAC